MDKILAVIIIFIAMMFLMAAVLAMGAVPKIFQTSEIVNQTLIQKHEDEAREAQKFQIITETNKSMNQSLTSLEERLYQFMNLSAERSEKGQKERQKIIDDLLNVSKKQEVIQGKVQNLTQNIYDLLKSADDRNYEVNTKNLKILTNLTEELKVIKLRLP